MIMGYQQGKRRLDVEEEADNKWVNRYSTNHGILLVGEGDFSFSLSMARSIGYATNMVATSLDSYSELIKNYKQARVNLEILKEMGAVVIHGVDATNMKFHRDLRMKEFDRIVFNFPHAGFLGKEGDDRVIEMHRDLVLEFFRNAKEMLGLDGEIHVNHKTSPPFSLWNIEELACKTDLFLIECIDFKKEDYPGYNHKRGQGDRCDEPFPLGESSTFKFGISYFAKLRRAESRFEFGRTEHQPALFCSGNLQASFSFTNSLVNRQSGLGIDVHKESANLRHGCNHAWEIHDPSFNLLTYPVHESENYNIKRYRVEATERTVPGDHYMERRFSNNLLGHRQSILNTDDPCFNVATYPVREPRGCIFKRYRVEARESTVRGDHPVEHRFNTPEHMRSSFATGFQREGFNHALQKHDPAFNIGAYSQNYNFRSYRMEALERTVHGDHRMMPATEPLSRIIRRANLQYMLFRYGQHPEQGRSTRTGQY